MGVDSLLAKVEEEKGRYCAIAMDVGIALKDSGVTKLPDWSELYGLHSDLDIFLSEIGASKKRVKKASACLGDFARAFYETANEVDSFGEAAWRAGYVELFGKPSQKVESAFAQAPDTVPGLDRDISQACAEADIILRNGGVRKAYEEVKRKRALNSQRYRGTLVAAAFATYQPFMEERSYQGLRDAVIKVNEGTDRLRRVAESFGTKKDAKKKEYVAGMLVFLERNRASVERFLQD